jgi:hypothetical protein
MKIRFAILFTLILTVSYAQGKTTESKDTLKQVKKEEDLKIVPFNTIERVPVYLGCDEQLSNKKLKKCMIDEISSFVLKKFNTRMASYLKPTVKKRKNNSDLQN